MSSTAASNLAGLWFGELAAAWQQAVAAGHNAVGQQQQRKLLQAGPGKHNKQKVAAPAPGTAGRKARAEEGDNVGRCGGAMSDTTLYLLLDRFTPS
ncbi:unnamed protein product [Urochloa humidicola]